MKDLENAMAEAGFKLSNDLPMQETTEDVVEQTVAPTNVEPTPNETASEQAPVESGVPDTQPETISEPPVQESVQEPAPQVTQNDVAPDIDVESEVLKYLSERLGTEVSDFNYLTDAISNKPVEIDERVAAINDFVKKTGRSPEDWYKYQQLNPTEMDDVTAVRNQMVIEHDNLTIEEVNMLVNNKYKLDADRYDENEVSMAKLQLKMDAESARKTISELRDGYQLPVDERGEVEAQSPITEDWVNAMTNEVNDFDGLIFNLPSGENFTFGIKDDYRKTLISKNARLEQFFDDYVNDGGDWNFEKLNAHRAVIDNIDNIVKSVYQQGLSDGQRKVVQNAANVSNETAQRDTTPQTNSLDEQLLKAFGGGNSLTFKF
tara:strand:- start:21613 stop:22740 length:1128 start_codon:yes stop_codon:yes gene_type:complete